MSSPAIAPEAAPTGTADADMPRGRPRTVRAELRKIFTTNTWWVIGVFVLGAAGLALLLNVSGTNQELATAEFQLGNPPDFENLPPDRRPTAAQQVQELQRYAEQTDIPAILARGAAEIYTSGQFLGLLLVAILGALVVTNEFQHQTATATFLTTPQRTKVVTAKLWAAVILAVGYWLLATAVSVGAGALDFSVRGHDILYDDPVVLRAVGMNLLAYTLWAVMGVGFGVLLRGQLSATLTTTAVYLSAYPSLIVFGLIRSLAGTDRVYDFIVLMPGIASMVMVDPQPMQFDADTFAPAWWVGAATLVAYGVLAGVIGTLITRRRDIS